jgi:hypothetical protein
MLENDKQFIYSNSSDYTYVPVNQSGDSYVVHWIEQIKLLDSTAYTNEEYESLSINNHSKHYCVRQPELKQNQRSILAPLYTQFCGQIIFCIVYFNVV